VAIGLYGHWVLHQLVSVVVTSPPFTCITIVGLYVAEHIGGMRVVDIAQGLSFDEGSRPSASMDTGCYTSLSWMW